MNHIYNIQKGLKCLRRFQIDALLKTPLLERIALRGLTERHHALYNGEIKRLSRNKCFNYN